MADSGTSADTDSDPAGGSAAVSLRGVTKVYDNGVVALGPIDLEVRRGEFVSLLGPSGCGKSTALRLIAGLGAPSSGTLRVARTAAEVNGGHPIGFVFQEPTLMPWTTVRENVRLPLKLAHVPLPGAKARVDEALDEITRFRLNNDLLALWRSLRKTVIFVTHSVFESVYLSQRVVVMTSRPGRIATEISIEASEPRGEDFRTSADYAGYCRKVSNALAPAYSGPSA